MNYYNEIDPSAAAWLAALMADNLIPHGHIDTRSICDVEPSDLEGYAQCHFFAGIGGWSLALKLAGWPETRPVWTGSCPCQPFSDAGKGLGEADPRHLWPYFRNLIGNCRPAVVFGEQVGSKAGRLWLSRVRSDFQNAAYAFGAADLAAASLGAPHKRQRLFWVADSQCFRAVRRSEDKEGPTDPGSELRGKLSSAVGQNGDASGLADSTDTDRRIGEHIPQERTGQDRQRRRGPAIGGANGRLDDTAGARQQPERQRPEGEARDQARLRRPERRRTISSRLGYAILPGLEVRSGGSQDGRPPEETSSATQLSMFGCGLGNSPCSGSAGADGSSEQEQGPGTGSVHAFWRDTRWIPTTDPRTGKTVMRRIPLEPSLFPLAQRIPGRVGLLRGAGNAIVPQVAGEFIQAYLETL